jgi:hypothetical protein
MTDNNQQQGQYGGGFAFNNQNQQGQQGGQQGGQTQPVPPVQPVQPVYPAAAPVPGYPAPAPAYQAPPVPVQPAYAAPAPVPGYPAPAPMPGYPAPAAPAYPAAGQTGGRPPVGGGAKPPVKDPNHDPNYVFGTRMATFTTTIVLAAHKLNFDETRFINLLAGSISLTKDEKKKILDSIPKLRQAQVDELIRIFDEERAKFVELSPKHGSQLKKLEDEHHADWKDIEMMYKQESQSQEDESKADEIRKQLGL